MEALAAVIGVMVATGTALALAATAQAHCGGEHVVKPGDTLSAIAARCHSTVAGLARANAQVSDPDMLLIGWRLTIPEALGHDAPGPEHGRAADERAEAPAPPPQDEPGLVSLEGRIAEGPECPVLRTPDGQVYSLVGEMDFTPGAYVEVTGRTAAISFCMRGTTVEVISMDAVDAPSGQ